jgi:hypothetical protein
MSNDPCRVCGSAVRIDREERPRMLGASTPDHTEVRVCTNADCRTNGPRSQRRLGEVP